MLGLQPNLHVTQASRSLHPRQPRSWLRHTPHLRMAQTLKPRCRVCAVRTRSLREAASVGRILVSDKTFNTPVIIAIHCSNAQNVGFENPTYAKLIKCSLYGCVKTISMPFEHCRPMMRIISGVPKE